MKLAISIVIVFAIVLSGANFVSAQNTVKKGQQMKSVQMQKKVVKKTVKKLVPMKKPTVSVKKDVKVKVKAPAKTKMMQGGLDKQPKAVQEEYMRRMRESQKETKGMMESNGDPMPVPAAQQGASMQPASEVMVTYSENGFSPASVTVKVGEKVKFVNQGSGGMWVASAMHPTHQLYPEFDQLSTGNEYTFEFKKAGSWNYHNHVNPSHFGKVIVE